MKSAGLALIVIALGVATGVYLSRQPWQEFAEQRSATQEAARDMRKAENERAELARQSAISESPVGRETIARERGYRRPNETPVDDLK